MFRSLAFTLALLGTPVESFFNAPAFVVHHQCHHRGSRSLLKSESESPESMESVDPSDLYEEPPPDRPSWLKGDLDGMDDPIDSAWRSSSEALIRQAGDIESVKVLDITWKYARLEITVDKETDGDGQTRLIKKMWELWEAPTVPEECSTVLERHEIGVSTPGAPSVLSTQAEFDAYVGFDVQVYTTDPFKSNRTLEGKLVLRDAMFVKINVKGRTVTVPNDMVSEVKLPKPKVEKGDPFN